MQLPLESRFHSTRMIFLYFFVKLSWRGLIFHPLNQMDGDLLCVVGA